MADMPPPACQAHFTPRRRRLSRSLFERQARFFRRQSSDWPAPLPYFAQYMILAADFGAGRGGAGQCRGKFHAPSVSGDGGRLTMYIIMLALIARRLARRFARFERERGAAICSIFLPSIPRAMRFSRHARSGSLTVPVDNHIGPRISVRRLTGVCLAAAASAVGPDADAELRAICARFQPRLERSSAYRLRCQYEPPGVALFTRRLNYIESRHEAAVYLFILMLDIELPNMAATSFCGVATVSFHLLRVATSPFPAATDAATASGAIKALIDNLRFAEYSS